MTNNTEFFRKLCLSQQTELRQIMMTAKQHDQAMQLFLKQHAMLHTAKMAQTEPWSFEDDVLHDMNETQIRRIPQTGDHSLAWLIWHVTRCEDITMNLLVAGSPQILHRDAWLELMKITLRDTGNAMDAASMADFSRAVDIPALLGYRLAVGRRTQEIARQLQPDELKQKVQPPRLQQVLAEGAVVEAAIGIANYWGGRTIAGLLLMPASRHILTHWNEALEVKRQK